MLPPLRPCAAAPPLPMLLLAVPPPAARHAPPQAVAAWQETLPNALTLARVAAVPALAAAFYTPRAAAARAPAALFAACAATDWLDGYLARRWDVQSEFGAFLDPVADKLLVCTSLVLLSGAVGAAVALPTAVIVGREVGVSALREWMATTGRSAVVAVSRWGKLKTATQLVSLLLLLLARPADAALRRGGLALLYAAAALSCTSAAGYVSAAWPKKSGA